MRARSAGLALVEQHLRHGLDVRDVNLVELADVGKDFVELTLVGRNLLGCEFHLREFGDSQHVVPAYFHRELRKRFRLHLRKEEMMRRRVG